VTGPVLAAQILALVGTRVGALGAASAAERVGGGGLVRGRDRAFDAGRAAGPAAVGPAAQPRVRVDELALLRLRLRLRLGARRLRLEQGVVRRAPLAGSPVGRFLVAAALRVERVPVRRLRREGRRAQRVVAGPVTRVFTVHEAIVHAVALSGPPIAVGVGERAVPVADPPGGERVERVAVRSPAVRRRPGEARLVVPPVVGAVRRRAVPPVRPEVVERPRERGVVGTPVAVGVRPPVLVAARGGPVVAAPVVAQVPRIVAATVGPVALPTVGPVVGERVLAVPTRCREGLVLVARTARVAALVPELRDVVQRLPVRGLPPAPVEGLLVASG